MTFIVTHLINGSAFHVDSQLTPPSGTKTSWSQSQVLRSHSIFITRYSRDIIHKKTDTDQSPLLRSRRNHARNVRSRQLMALLWGSCWLRLCSGQPRLVEAAWPGPEASTVDCTPRNALKVWYLPNMECSVTSIINNAFKSFFHSSSHAVLTRDRTLYPKSFRFSSIHSF